MSNHRVELENNEWCYSHSDGVTKHGQHLKFTGACNYVNYRLYDAVVIEIIKNKRKER